MVFKEFELTAIDLPLDDISIDYKDNFEADKCEFIIHPDVDIKVGDEIKILNSGLLFFQGYISKISGTDYSTNNIICYTYEKKLLNRIVDDLFIDINIIDLIELLVTTYSDLSFSSTYTSNIIIPRLFVKSITAWDLIIDLMGRIEEVTYKIRDKQFILFPKGETLAPISLINGSNIIIEDGWENDDENQVTVLTLLGEKYEENTTDTFIGDGVSTNFILTRIPKSIKVEVNGIEKKLEIEEQTPGDYTLNKRNKTITFKTAPANSHSVIVNYSFEENVKVVHQASPDIIEEYGIIDKSFTKKFLQDFNSALDYAIEYVDSHSLPNKTATAIYIEDLNLTAFYPGMKIFVIDNINKIDGQNINEELLISEIGFKYPEGRITIRVGDIPNKLSYFLREQEYNIRQLYEQDDNSEIVQASQTLRNDIEIEVETITEVWQRDLPAEYIVFSNDGDFSQIGDGTVRKWVDESVIETGVAGVDYWVFADESVWGDSPDDEQISWKKIE